MTLRSPLQRQYRCCGFREVRWIQKPTAEEQPQDPPGMKGAQSCLEEKLCHFCRYLAPMHVTAWHTQPPTDSRGRLSA